MSARAYRTVSRASPLPLYRQIEIDIRRRIEATEWRPGDQIPTEMELCALYGASRITIREAVGGLVADGLLLREAGRGTFVREARITAGVRGLTSFTDELRVLGMTPGARVLRSAAEASPAEVADRLGIAAGDPVAVVARLRVADGDPIGIQTAYLPSERFPGLEAEDLGERSLYALLEERYGVVPREAEETFVAAPIKGEDARLLGVRSGACGLSVERLTFDDRSAFELVRSVMRGDRYSVRLGLRAPAQTKGA